MDTKQEPQPGTSWRPVVNISSCMDGSNCLGFCTASIQLGRQRIRNLTVHPVTGRRTECSSPGFVHTMKSRSRCTTSRRRLFHISTICFRPNRLVIKTRTDRSARVAPQDHPSVPPSLHMLLLLLQGGGWRELRVPFRVQLRRATVHRHVTITITLGAQRWSFFPCLSFICRRLLSASLCQSACFSVTSFNRVYEDRPTDDGRPGAPAP